jgi:hypothetical protein
MPVSTPPAASAGLQLVSIAAPYGVLVKHMVVAGSLNGQAVSVAVEQFGIAGGVAPACGVPAF